jgi:molybdopterin-containing oxidoreductase family iron-sulfur binding subunit
VATDEPRTGTPPGPQGPDETAGARRRTVLKLLGGAVGAVAFAKAMEPLTGFTNDLTLDQFLQRHYKELDPDELAAVLRRIEADTLDKHGASVQVESAPPLPGVQFGYALNLSICNGCRKCAEACHRENNHDRDTNNSYIRVFEMTNGSLDFEHGDPTYTHATPAPGKYYMPVQCQQCDNPPCVSVCPVEATWKEPDGVVVVDYDWCIGCRYCEAACPYHARRFNWKEPRIPADEINPDQGYLSNRIRPQGVMEKCTFCLHRTRRGQLPACAEACPTGARVFGNLLDPDSEIRWVLANKRVFVLKEELGTRPRFFYFFDK